MGLVTCPHCGKKISDTVEACIYCGSDFTVCPECKIAYNYHDKACPFCGYRNEGITDLFENWKSKFADNSVIINIIKYLVAGFTIIATLLIAVIALRIVMWNGQILIVKSCQNMSIIACVMFGAAITITDVFEWLQEVQCSTWLRKNKYDLKKFIDCIYQLDDLDMPNGWDYDKLKSAVYLSTSAQAESSKLRNNLLKGILKIVSIIIISIFLNENIYELLRYRFIGEFRFNFTIFIIMVICVISSVSLNNFLTNRYKKAVDQWYRSV